MVVAVAKEEKGIGRAVSACKKDTPTEVRTQAKGFKVLCANHYTIRVVLESRAKLAHLSLCAVRGLFSIENILVSKV